MKLFLISILNLGETILLSLGISDIDHQGIKHSLMNNVFDFFTKQGLSFDRNVPGGQKTPLGFAQIGDLPVRLTGSANVLVNALAQPQLHSNSQFPQIMSDTKFAHGSILVYGEYLKKITAIDRLATPFQVYRLKMLAEDLMRYKPQLLAKQKMITHKNSFYRPLTILVNDLYLFLPLIVKGDSFERINYFFDAGIIKRRQETTMKYALQLILYLRLQQHFTYGEQKTAIHRSNRIFQSIQKNSLYLFNHFERKFIRYESRLLINQVKLNQSMKEYSLTHQVFK